MSSAPPPRRIFPAPAAYTEQAEADLHRRKPFTVAAMVVGGIVIAAALFWMGRTLLHTARQVSELTAALHGHMQRHEFDAIYDESSPGWKANVTREGTTKLFTRIDNELGAPLSTTRTGYRTNYENGDSFLFGTFATKFALDDKGSETIQWKLVDGTYRLYFYHVNAPKLKKESPDLVQ